jgi:hypothetical protein
MGDSLISVKTTSTQVVSDAAQVHVSPDGTQAVFAGVIMDKLEGTPPTRIPPPWEVRYRCSKLWGGSIHQC